MQQKTINKMHLCLQEMQGINDGEVREFRHLPAPLIRTKISVKYW